MVSHVRVRVMVGYGADETCQVLARYNHFTGNDHESPSPHPLSRQ